MLIIFTLVDCTPNATGSKTEGQNLEKDNMGKKAYVAFGKEKLHKLKFWAF